MVSNRMGVIVTIAGVVLLLIWFMAAANNAVQTTDGADAAATETE